MRVVCISDTHEKHRELGELPEGDLLIHAGDVSMIGAWDARGAEACADFVRWFEEQPHRWKVVIPGNHDFHWVDWQRPKAHDLGVRTFLLIDEWVVVDSPEYEIKIYGSPWTPRFGHWAFMEGPEIRERWDAIPEDTDILITHGPPYRLMDQPWGDREHVGCVHLANRVENIHPRLHVFGHIHGSYGRVDREEIKMSGVIRRTSVNASVVGEDYRVQNAPIVVDL